MRVRYSFLFLISDNGKRGGSIKVKYKTLDQLELITSKLKN